MEKNKFEGGYSEGYSVNNLQEIADHFETLSQQNLEQSKIPNISSIDKLLLLREHSVWQAAANILRRTVIVSIFKGSR